MAKDKSDPSTQPENPTAYIADLADFQPDPDNLNLHTQRGQALVTQSQQKRGYARPAFAANDGTVLGGNLSTMEVASDIGLGDGKVLVVETTGDIPIIHKRLDVEPGSVEAKLLAAEDNRSAELSITWDPKQLLLDKEAGIDFGGLFYDNELDEITAEIKNEPSEIGPPPVDRADELQEKWQVDKGDIWQISSESTPGRYHRLLCGDCRNFDDLALLVGKKVNGIFTSPPYAMQRAKQYGGTPVNEYVEWWEDVQAGMQGVLAKDGSFFVNIKPHCTDGQRVLYVMDLVLAMVRRWGWRIVDELCWVRTTLPGEFTSRFKNEWEPIYHFSRNKPKFCSRNVLRSFELGSEKMPTYKEAGNTTFGMRGGRKSQNFDGALPGNVMTFHRDHNSKQAAVFPLKLPTFFIRAYSDLGDTWLDPFCGSGTVLVACENEKRIGYGIEILPKYCSVILERMTSIGLQPALVENIKISSYYKK